MIALDLHPLCTLFPRIEGAEFEALKADIAANGLREPIVIHEEMILDGGNRYRACVEAGVEPVVVPYAGNDPLAFVLSSNLHRRHLTPGQQAAIVSAATDWLEAQTHGGDRKSDQAATLPLDTVADRAAQSGASERTQRMADKVAKQDPELAKRVAHGEVSLPAAVRQIEAKTAEHSESSSPAEHAQGDDSQSSEGHSHVDINEDSSSTGDDPYAEIERLQGRVSALSREIDSLAATDTGAEIHKLTQLLFNAEARIASFEEKQKQLKWFGSKFSELRLLLGVKFDRDVIGAVRKMVEGRE